MRRLLNLTVLFLVGGFAAGVTAEQPVSSPAPIHLTATMISPTDARLDWQDEQKAAGHIVEWAMETNRDYTILAFVLPYVSSFVHPDLAPEMKCCYRIRPYFGQASRPVEVVTGKAASSQELNAMTKTWAEPKVTAEGSAAEKFSMRDASTIGKAAPTDLKTKLMVGTGIQFTWVDHANDEEGYMLEMKTDADSDFHVFAIVEPNVTSFGCVLPLPESKVSFRVRAFYYGAPSNLAVEKTGIVSPPRAGQK